MICKTNTWIAAGAGLAISLLGGTAFADTIDPTSFSADIAVGESVTIRKTVVIEEGTADASIDVMFLIDTTGSMGGAIDAAKLAAADILTGLAGSGVGEFRIATFAEEQGFVGCTMLLLLFWMLIVWGLRTASDSRDRFCALLSVASAPATE